MGVVLSLCSGYATASTHGWSQASDIARTAVVASGLGLAGGVDGDWKGTIQAGESVGAAFLISEGLKQAIPEMRPDRSIAMVSLQRILPWPLLLRAGCKIAMAGKWACLPNSWPPLSVWPE